MDLRSIIHSDGPSTTTSTSTAKSPSTLNTYPLFGAQADPSAQSSYTASSPGPGGYAGRPQPPPLQPPTPGTAGGLPSSATLQSPYQHTPSTAIAGGSYPFPRAGQQSPPPRGPGYPDSGASGYGTNQPYGHGASSPFNPPATTLGGSYSYGYNQPPQSPHSTVTPLSAQSQTPFPHRESPVSSTGPPQYSRQESYFNQQSQAPTPLGPPLFHRASDGNQNKAQSPFTHERTTSGSSFTGQRISALSPSPMSPGVSTNTVNSLGAYQPAQSPLTERERDREYGAQRERERSISVSPKTVKAPSLSHHGSTDSRYNGHDSWDGGQVTPAKRKQTDESVYHPSNNHSTDISRHYADPSKSVSSISSVRSLMNGSTSSQSAETSQAPDVLVKGEGNDTLLSRETNLRTAFPPQSTVDTERPSSRDRPLSATPSMTPTHYPSASPQPQSSDRASSTQSPAQAAMLNQPPSRQPSNHSTAIKREGDNNQPAATSPHQPAKKKPRYDEPPLWARKASRGSSSSALLPNKRPNSNHSSSHPAKQEQKPAAAQSSSLPPVKEESNGLTGGGAPNVTLPRPQAVLGDKGPLGPWEPSITNVTPYEEVTRVISDFLFTEVVERSDVGMGAPGVPPSQHAQIEIEAKLGHIVDKNTNDRLRLPVLTETVLSKAADLRIAFESSMTESQHRTLNEFLNKSLINSQPGKPTPQSPAGDGPARPRIPMSYVHTRERDSFFELSPNIIHTLPPSIRQQINPRHKLKVRVTTDQKTGNVLAKIIKVRIADLDVYSPRTAFDWRVSINLEMNYEGEIDGLIESHEGGRRNDRNKDRMSYRHLAYQIALTQVTPADATAKTVKEHELEVEVDAAEVRRQGILAKTGQITQYEDLVRGFVDNVRVLARVVNPIEHR